MVFFVVFTNCHLPSVILYCKNDQSSDQPAFIYEHIYTFVDIERYTNIMLFYTLSRAF